MSAGDGPGCSRDRRALSPRGERQAERSAHQRIGEAGVGWPLKNLPRLISLVIPTVRLIPTPVGLTYCAVVWVHGRQRGDTSHISDGSQRMCGARLTERMWD